MLYTLPPDALTVVIDTKALGFSTTAELSGQAPLWIGQADAQKATAFGLAMPYPHFNLLVLGESGSGRTSMLLESMRQQVKRMPAAHDIIYLNNFKQSDKPLMCRLKQGGAEVWRVQGEQLNKRLQKLLQALLANAEQEGAEGKSANMLAHMEDDKNLLLSHVTEMKSALSPYFVEDIAEHNAVGEKSTAVAYLDLLQTDITKGLQVFQAHIAQSGNQDAEGMIDSLLARYRVNVLVSHANELGAPVVYDDDPSFASLFGGIEASSEQHQGADMMRLRAGNLLRADGGFLLLHMRDLYADESEAPKILEKLHRYLRNGTVRFDDFNASSSGVNAPNTLSLAPIPISTKLVLIATPEEYYELHDEFPEFGSYFRVKVDFADRVQANTGVYKDIACLIAQICQQKSLPHFDAEAITRLLLTMHRRIDDQRRLSTQFAELQDLVLESAAYALAREAAITTLEDVEAALAARHIRLSMPERMMRESIIDGELMISVHGHAVGQINGLTHIELGDACFGSPVRISARYHAGEDGIINIDREVEMTGPNHDKGLFILQNWLSASFPKLTPLSLNASLVFEQEYHGVEGDSASCAELYALLSAISGKPLPQGVAVTGAMNQHGEVMAVGGVNEKIEGFFRLCKQMGLDGTQGVLIPERNCAHLVLDKDVLDAVQQGLFHVYPISHVLQGISHLTGISPGALDERGDYPEDSFMGKVQAVLEGLRKTFDNNKSEGKEESSI